VSKFSFSQNFHFQVDHRQILELLSSFCLLFINNEQAFGSADRKALEVAYLYCIPDKYTKVIVLCTRIFVKKVEGVSKHE